MILTSVNKFILILTLSIFSISLVGNLFNVDLSFLFILKNFSNISPIIFSSFHETHLLEIFFFVLSVIFLGNELEIFYTSKKYLLMLSFTLLLSHTLFLLLPLSISSTGSIYPFLITLYALSFPYKPMSIFISNFFLPSYQMCSFFLIIQFISLLQQKLYGEIILSFLYILITCLVFFIFQKMATQPKRKFKIIKDNNLIH